MSVALLPADIQQKFEYLAQQIRRHRLARGGIGLLGYTLIALTLLLLGDALFQLPSAIRWLLLLTAVVGWFALLYRWVWRPFQRPVEAASLAALVEEKYPGLRERLSSAVSIGENDHLHGSPDFARWLVKETGQRTRELDFQQAFVRPTVGLFAGVCVFTMMWFLGPGLLWPQEYLGTVRRCFLPWDRRPAIIPFDIEVTPANAHAALGRPLAFSATLTPRHAQAFPEAVTLAIDPEQGAPIRVRMPADPQPGSYRFQLDAVKSHFRYRVIADSIESETYAITGVAPIELAEAPALTITPPAYARHLPAQKIDGVPTELQALQYSQASLRYRFTSLPSAARLVFQAESDQDAQRRFYPVTIDPDGRVGTVNCPLSQPGRLHLEMDAGHDVLSQTPVTALRLILDQAPQFRKVVGMPPNGQVAMTDSVNLDVTVADDLGVGRLFLESRIGDGPIQRHDIPLATPGLPLSQARYSWALNGSVKEGDRLRLRLLLEDIRSLPELQIGPNLATYPANDQWAEYQIVRAAESMQRQEIAAERDQLDKLIRDLIAAVLSQQRASARLRQETEQRKLPRDEQDRQLKVLAERHKELTAALRKIHDLASLAGLAPIVEATRALDEQEFTQAGQAITETLEVLDGKRLISLRRLESILEEARKKLEALLALNREFAEHRIDQHRLEQMAERQNRLADQLEQVKSNSERDQIGSQQRQLTQELQRQTESNERLREAIKATQNEPARRMAEQAQQLAEHERELDRQIRQREQAERMGPLDELAKRQKQLTEQVESLANQTKVPAEVAKSEPLNVENARNAVESMQKGDVDNALRQQDRNAKELDRLAEALQKGQELSADPREAVKQLQRWQQSLRERIQQKTTAAPAEREAWESEQNSLKDRLNRIEIPEANRAALKEQKEASEQAASAAKKLKENQLSRAGDAMQETSAALSRLGAALPSSEQRMQAARNEVVKLRDAQKAVESQANRAEQLQRSGNAAEAEKEKSQAALKQAEIASRLGKLDLPEKESRKQKAVRSAGQALRDLQTPNSPDLAASQQDIGRQLERLEAALSGQTPADEKAAQLARQQQALADQLSGRQNDLESRQERLAAQERILNEARSLKATEAPARLGEAQNAAAKSAQALKNANAPADAARKAMDAAAKLHELAEQMAGQESPARQLERLRSKLDSTKETPRSEEDQRNLETAIESEARQIRAGAQAATEKLKALEQLGKLRQMPPNAKDKPRAKAEAMQALRDWAARTQGESTASKPVDLESLARGQRELADQTAQAARATAKTKDGDREAMQKRQSDLNRLAQKIDSETAPQAVAQAREAMNRAEQNLAQADLAEAARQQGKAADALQQAARESQVQKPNSMPSASPGLPSNGQAQQAKELAKEQRELSQQVRELTASMPSGADSEQKAQQAELARQTSELQQALKDTAEKSKSWSVRQKAQQAAQTAQQAREAMERSQNEKANEGHESREQAASALEQASDQLQGNRGNASASKSMSQEQQSQVGNSLEQALQQMSQANSQAIKNDRDAAQKAMRQAAQNLQQAARQMTPAQTPSLPQLSQQPTEVATDGQTPASSQPLAQELRRHAGKRWGELPGELRTRLLQEIKAQYGEDYSRIIRLYFEQIADQGVKPK